MPKPRKQSLETVEPKKKKIPEGWEEVSMYFPLDKGNKTFIRPITR